MNPLLQDKKIEGYWYSDDPINVNYPIPIPNILTDTEAVEIYRLIKLKEQEPETETIRYRGPSFSRITGQSVGGTEYHHSSGWVWPCALADHYVLQHKVKPSTTFLKFIGFIE